MDDAMTLFERMKKNQDESTVKIKILSFGIEKELLERVQKKLEAEGFDVEDLILAAFVAIDKENG